MRGTDSNGGRDNPDGPALVTRPLSSAIHFGCSGTMGLSNTEHKSVIYNRTAATQISLLIDITSDANVHTDAHADTNVDPDPDPNPNPNADVDPMDPTANADADVEMHPCM